MHVLGALLYLRLTSLRNLLAVRLRRLKQPKYLFGAAAGVAYFWFFFLRHTLRSSGGNSGQGLAVLFSGGYLEPIAAVVLTAFLVLAWITPGDQAGLTFTEAETAFLFPAPLSRRQLIHYKLLSGLLTTLLGAVFFTLVTNGFRGGAVMALRHLGAWCMLNAILSLHTNLATLAVARLSRLGLTAFLRRLLLCAALLAVLLVLVIAAVHVGPEKLAWLLWPARLIVRPFLADSFPHYLLALLPPLAIVALHYVAVLRLETPFEEASLAQAKKLADRVTRFREGKGVQLATPTKARRESFRLSRRLPPESALLWKNLMAVPDLLNRYTWLGAALLAGGGAFWLKHQTGFDGDKFAGILGFLAFGLLLYALALGPQLIRNDLRGDLLNLDLLKTYPLPGWRLVLGSLLGPTVVLTGITWLFLLIALVALPPVARLEWFTIEFRLAFGLAVGAVLPVLCAIQLLVPNTATLVFPAWAQTGRPAAGGGVDVLGQRLIFFAGQMLCLVLALLPAVFLAGGTIFLTQWAIGLPAAVLLAALPVILILALEVWFGVVWVGGRFEQLDISAELRG